MLKLLCLLATFLCLACSAKLRKEIRNMTTEEFDDYMDAILVYKFDGRKDVRSIHVLVTDCPV